MTQPQRERLHVLLRRRLQVLRLSFDPYVADTDSAQATLVNGVHNSAQLIPPGNYYVVWDAVPLVPIFVGAVSQIFKHQYTENCSDYFNGTTDRCAQYYFEVIKSQTPSCTGANCFGPPLGSNSGIPVIPLYYREDSPIG